jgi:hypothetical protein
MEEIADVLATVGATKAERLAAQKAFLEKGREIWEGIREGRFPATYPSANNKKFVGAPSQDDNPM